MPATIARAIATSMTPWPLLMATSLLAGAPEVEDGAQSPSSRAISTSTPSKSVPPLSWDIEGGGVPDSGVLASARVGLSRIGEIRVEFPAAAGLMIGAWVGFDLGYWTPIYTNQGSFVFGARSRFRLVHNSQWSIGASGSIGGLVGLADEGGGGLLIPLEGRALYALNRRFLFGVAVDIPIRLTFQSGPNNPIFSIPMTFGLAGEVHLFPSLALTAVLGAGPALDSRGVETAFRGTLGLGYRF